MIQSLSTTFQNSLVSVFNGNNVNKFEHTVANSTVVVYHIVQPNECTQSGILTGGSLLKKMDECAAISAVKHCKHPVVTGCIGFLIFFVS